MIREEIACIIQWFAHIEQLATDRKNANGFVVEDVGHLLNTIKVIAKDSREYVERFCQPSLPSNLDEVVEEMYPDFSNSIASKAAVDAVRDACKVRIEWMANQGVSYEDTISSDKTIPVLPMKYVYDMGFGYGDRVIVQIRKR